MGLHPAVNNEYVSTLLIKMSFAIKLRPENKIRCTVKTGSNVLDSAEKKCIQLV